MKRIAPLFFLLISIGAMAQKKAPSSAPKKPAAAKPAAASGADGYAITVTLKPFKNQWIYLGHYYGKQMPIIDSVKLNEQSVGVFRGNAPLGGGIYLIGYPDRAHNFEILVDKGQRFSVFADTLTGPQGISFSGSPENTEFQEYQRAMSTAGRQADSLVRLRSSQPQDSVRLTKEVDAITQDVQVYRNRIMTVAPNSLLATLLKAMKDPEMPIKTPKTKEDSVYNYRYFKNHFFDGVQLYDERLARTPFFEAKVDRYFDQLLYPAADSVTKEIDNVMAYAHINKEMEKFFLLKFVNRYLNMKYMWEDAVFVHLYEKYFLNKDYEWLSEKGKKIIQDNAYRLYGAMFGKEASDIELPDSNGKKIRLFDVKAPYTLVVIWDPTCSHCKETLPKIDTLYNSKWKAMGLKIYALAKETDGTRKDWTEFITKKNLQGWLNVYYTKEAEKARIDSNIPSYSQLYDVTSFPTIYLLDETKHVIAKKVGEKQIDEILEIREKEKKTKASK